MRALRAKLGVCLAAALAVVGCGQIGLGPKAAESAPAAPMGAAVPDFDPAVGEGYTAFAARPEMAAYTTAGLGLSADDRVRFEAAMATSGNASWVASGGGAEALVFVGCAEVGCDAGRAVLAIDVSTGAPFVGAADAEGTTALIPNPRVEALLRLSSPSRAWEDLPRAPPNPAPVSP